MTEKNLYQIKQIGAVHNFGKSTYIRSDGKVVKPRNTAWEAAFLSNRSPLRQQIDLICRGARLQVPLPDLYYSSASEGGSAVDALSLAPLKDLTLKDVESVGVLIAIAVWFGMTDLTSEKVVAGRKSDGAFCAGPIDVECLLKRIKCLSDTGLLGPSCQMEQLYGLAPIRASLGQMANTKAPAILIGVFSSILSLFLQNKHELSQQMTPLLTEPIRIKLKSTEFYRTLLTGEQELSSRTPLLEEEIRQLRRGEIPYFFCLPNQEKIYWFDSQESIKQVKDETIRANSPYLPSWPLLATNEDISELTQICVKELLAYFWQGNHLNAAHSGIEILSNDDGLRVKSHGQYAPLES